MVHAMQHQHTQPIHLVGQAPGFGQGHWCGEGRHTLKHGALPLAQRQALWPGAPPVVPEQLRAYMVKPLQAAQIPAQPRIGRQVRQLGRQGLPLRTGPQLGSAPSPARLRTQAIGRVGTNNAGSGVGHDNAEIMAVTRGWKAQRTW